MKKIIFPIIFILIIITTTSCQAKTNFYVSLHNGDFISKTNGEKSFKKFYELATLGKPCSLTLEKTYTLDGNYSKEYYENNKNNYPKTYVIEISFNGRRYKVKSDDSIYATYYKYLKCDVIKGKESSSYAVSYTYYLVDDLNHDTARHQRDLLSSVIVLDPIKYYGILTIYEYKGIHFSKTVVNSVSYLNTEKTYYDFDGYQLNKVLNFLDNLNWNEGKPYLFSNNKILFVNTKRILSYDGKNIFQKDLLLKETFFIYQVFTEQKLVLMYCNNSSPSAYAYYNTNDFNILLEILNIDI